MGVGEGIPLPRDYRFAKYSLSGWEEHVDGAYGVHVLCAWWGLWWGWMLGAHMVCGVHVHGMDG